MKVPLKILRINAITTAKIIIPRGIARKGHKFAKSILKFVQMSGMLYVRDIKNPPYEAEDLLLR
jgi:hypothetical protein